MEKSSLNNTSSKVGQALLEQMKAGSSYWLMPWHKGLAAPHNPVTGRAFTGRNADILWRAVINKCGRHNEWATLYQWSKKGAKIRPGAKGTRIFKPRVNSSTDLFGGESGQLTGFNSYIVFNEADVHNYDPEHPDLFGAFKHYDSQHSLVNQLLEKTGATIRFEGTRAVYFTGLDEIIVPPRSHFIDTLTSSAVEAFYSTILHELIHWTRREGRSPRPILFNDYKQNYAFEELVAELGAVILCGDFGVQVSPKQDNAAYLNIWLKVLNDDFSYFNQALEMAQQAVSWLYSHTGVYPSYSQTESELAAEEYSDTVREPVAAKKTEIVSIPTGAIALRAQLSVICGHCIGEYLVTVQRYEERTACPECFGMNLHEGLWDS